MRLLYFSRDYSPHDHRILSALCASTHQVAYLRLEDSGRRSEQRLLPQGVEAIPWAGGRRPERGWSFLRYLPDLRRVIGAWQPDLIHAGPVPDAAFLSALCGFRPLVSMSWGYDLMNDVKRDVIKYWAARFALKRSTLLFADCRAVAAQAVRLGMDAERIEIFPWGVDLQHFTPRPEGESPAQSAMRKVLGWGEDTFVLLSTRAFAPVYGIRELAQAFGMASGRNPALRLLMVGGGSLEEEVRALFRREDLLERVHFAGQIPNPALPDYYRAADLYISASHTDGSSISLLEALACGRPALVSDIPGNLEWVREGIEGWSFRTGDVDAMAQAMLTACEKRDTLRVMGRNARRTAEERADWQKNGEIMLTGYERAFEIFTHTGEKHRKGLR